MGMQVIILLAALSALSAAAVDMYLPAFPAVASSLKISAGQVQQTLTIYLVGLGLGQSLYGPLLDRFGRRPPLLVGLSLFVIGSLLAAFAEHIQVLLLARFLQALGAAAGLVASRAIVTDSYDAQSAARVYSMLAQMMMIAPITAPTLGSLILLYGDWRFIFWLLSAFGILCLLFTLRLLPESLPLEQRITLSARSVVRNYSVQLSQSAFMFYTLASGFSFGCLFIYVTTSPFIFISIFNLSPSQFAYIFAINAGGIILVGQLNLWLLKHYTALHLLFAGLVIFACTGVLLFILVYLAWASLWSYWLLLGLGLSMLGLIVGNITAITMEGTQQKAGTASAVMGSIQFLLAALIGFAFSFAAPKLSTLPVAMLVLGLLSIGFCILGAKASRVLAE